MGSRRHHNKGGSETRQLDVESLELERANHSATPCAVERKNEGNARSDESEGENRRVQGQTQTKHGWDGMSDGDDRDRQQMAGDDANDSQALTSGDITKYRAPLESVDQEAASGVTVHC